MPSAYIVIETYPSSSAVVIHGAFVLYELANIAAYKVRLHAPSIANITIEEYCGQTHICTTEITK